MSKPTPIKYFLLPAVGVSVLLPVGIGLAHGLLAGLLTAGVIAIGWLLLPVLGWSFGP